MPADTLPPSEGRESLGATDTRHVRHSLGLLAALLALTVPLALGDVSTGANVRTVGNASLTLTVSAKANVFGAGLSVMPAAGGGGGTTPTAYALPAGARQLTFHGGSGYVTCCSGFTTPPKNGPEGGTPLTPGGTDIPAVGSISGVSMPKQMFLAGVFLGKGAPSGSPPSTDTPTRNPVLRQVFYVGGGPHWVNVPTGATRLFLGFADAYGFHGPAGWYEDNAGTVQIGLTVSTRAPTTVQVAARSLSISLYIHRFWVAEKNLSSCSGPFGESALSCTVRHGALVSICNKDGYHHRPLSFNRHNRFGGPGKHLVLKPGQCFKKRFVNPTKEPMTVKIYDEIHSQERMMITVMPQPR